MDDLSRLYKVSADYILGLSDDKTTNRYGQSVPLNSVVTFIHKQDIFNITEQLKKKCRKEHVRKFIHNLVFLLADLPDDQAKPIIESINLIIEQIKDISPYGKNSQITPQSYEFLKKNLTINTPEYSYLSTTLASACKEQSSKRFLAATKKYLTVIYYANWDTKDLAVEAINQLKYIHHQWSSFPSELSPIIKELDTLKKQKFLSSLEDPQIRYTIKNFINAEFDSISELLESL